MKEIPLTHGYVAWVDDEDYEALVGMRWHAKFAKSTGLVYAETNKPRPMRGTWSMHRLVMRAPEGVFVDHVRHRASQRVVDNRKENLRLASNQMNCANQAKKPGAKTSRFKGVSRRGGRWYAQIMRDGHNYYLGLYPTEALAARAHDLKAVELFGEFALTNFPVPGSTNWIYGPEVTHA